MFIGQEYYKQGYEIQYTGIIKKLEDMGRDLIARNNTEVLIIQYKNWSKEKEIHEKHIFQLYGTVVHYKITNKTIFEVKGIFITSTRLSKTAKEIAKYLNIDVKENVELQNFPRIKCNINKTTKEKIYHLPFDQQYDKTIIDRKSGEKYVLTVAEAEEFGFRRAFRHCSN